MKILRLSFQNINSLTHPEGKPDTPWEIDFTRLRGLFAITGPTGSGKTTILDAIVLALYGKTPRVDEKVNKSYAYVSLGAKRAFSEVCFEANHSTYLAQWNYRTVGKNGRPLATPEVTHKIYEVHGDTKRELGELGKKDNKTVDRYIGLSYEDFSKAILLAQGKFSELLFSSGKDRASMLQRITSTAIYTQIGQVAYEICTQKEQEIHDLQQKHDSLYILTDEQIAECRATIEHSQTEIAALDKKQEQTQHWIAQSRQRDHWVKDKQNAEQQLEKTNEQLKAVAPKRQLAERYRWAEPLKPYLEQKKTLEHQKRQLLLELDDNRRRISGLETAITDTRQQLAIAQASLEQARTEQLNKEPKLLQKEKQATEFRRLKREIEQVTQNRATLSEKVRQIQRKKSSVENQLNDVSKRLKELEDAQQLRQADAQLEGLLSGWQQTFNRVQELRTKVGRLDELQRHRKDQLTDLEREQQKLELRLVEMQDKVKSGESAVRGTEEKLKELIETHGSIENINARLQELNHQINQHKQATRIAQNLLTQIQEQKKKEDEALVAESEIRKWQEHYTKLNETVVQTKNVLAETEAHIRKLELQSSVPLLRAQLVPGQPCAVCGSTHHPDAHITWTDAALETARNHKDLLTKQLVEQEKQKNEAQNHQTRAETQRDSLIKEIENARIRLRNDTQEFEKLFPELTSIKHEPNTIATATAQLETELRSWQARQTEWNAEQQRLHAANQQLNGLKAEYAKAEKSQSERNRQLGELRIAIQSEDKNREDYLREGLELSTGLCGAIQPYFEEIIDKSKLKASLSALVDRNSKWQEARKNIEEQKSQKAKLEPELATLTANLNAEEKQLCDLTTQHQNLQTQVEPLQGLGLDTFNYEREKNELTQRVNDAEAQVNALRKQQEQQNVELTKLNSNEQNWSGQVERLDRDLEATQHKLTQGLTSAGFNNETEVADALNLEAEVVAHIEQGVRELENQQLVLTEQIKEQTQAIEILEAGLPAAATTEGLTAQAEELKEQHIQAVEEKSRSELELEKYEENVAQAKKYQEELDERGKKFETWQTLNRLLGGKGGRYFNEFAQSLTLKLLLRKANQLLNTLTDRYELIARQEVENQQNSTEYLDIWIRDRYKGSSERPVKNLSGGETFLVSLALSLALSEFASRNVELKSLFIDEGFGTLDPESLQQVLESLQKLSLQDKSVGVISHVDTLKEGIECQIRVEKNGITGTSTLRTIY